MSFSPKTWYMSEVWKIANKCQREVSELKLSSPLFKTMEHLYSELHKVTSLCTSQERERTDQVLMASEMKGSIAGSSVCQLLLSPCHVQLMCWLRNPALKELLPGGGEKCLHKWTMVQAVKCIDAAKWSMPSGEMLTGSLGRFAAGASIWFFSVERWRKTRYLLL